MESWVSMKNKITNICVVVTIIMIIVSQIYYAWGDYQEAASEKEKINLWHPLTGGDGEYFQEVVNKFNRQSEEYYIDVSVFKWDEYNAKLANAIAAGEGPDIQLTRNSFYSYLRTKNMIVDITDISQKVGIPWESYNPSALSIVKEEDRYFGVPIDTHPVVMYYNKDILNKAGVLDNSGQPEFVKSEEGFLEFLDKIAKSMPEGEYPIALPTYSKSAEQWYLWYTWYVYNGGKGLFNSEYTKAKIDKEAFTISADMEKNYFKNHIFCQMIRISLKHLQVEGQQYVLREYGQWKNLGKVFRNSEPLKFRIYGIKNRLLMVVLIFYQYQET